MLIINYNINNSHAINIKAITINKYNLHFNKREALFILEEKESIETNIFTRINYKNNNKTNFDKDLLIFITD